MDSDRHVILCLVGPVKEVRDKIRMLAEAEEIVKQTLEKGEEDGPLHGRETIQRKLEAH